MNQHQASPLRPKRLKSSCLKLSGLLTLVLTLNMPAHAQDAPAITPSLKKLLGGLPIAGIKDEVQGMIGDLKKTSCGGNLKTRAAG